MPNLCRPVLRFSLAAAAILLTACATPSTVLVNERGELYRCAASGQGLYGMAVAGGMHKKCVEDLKQAGYAVLPEGEMGIGFTPNTLVIRQLTAGKGAARAGLLVGDTVTRMNGTLVTRGAEVLRATEAVSVGSMIHVTVLRDGESVTLPVLVSKRGE